MSGRSPFGIDRDIHRCGLPDRPAAARRAPARVAAPLGVELLRGSRTPTSPPPATAYRAGAPPLARLDGRAVGGVGARGSAPGTGELKAMYVVPAARGLGIGRALLDAAVDTASELGLRARSRQSLPEEMAAAHGLDRARGFVDVPAYADLGIDGVSSLGLAPPAGQP